MDNISRMVMILTIAGGVTLLTRELPFLLFRRGKIPSFVLYLGKVLPMAVMSILILYSIRNISFDRADAFIPQLVSLAVVATIHLWKRNTTMSIFVGTACYMVLLRLL